MPDYNIEYTSWNNVGAKDIARSIDNDKIKGLSNKDEIIEFFNQAYDEGMNTNEINSLLGLNLKCASTSQVLRTTENLSQIINFYNKLDYIDRGNISYRANELGYERLNTLEKDINKAFDECEGYALIKLRRDRFEDRTRFDIEEVQKDVQTALKSLNELRDKLEIAYDNAKCIENHIPPQKPEYNLDSIAKRILGMSFEDFVKNNNLDFTKSITEAEAVNPNYENKAIYDKARAYVKEIKKLAKEELQNMRYDSGERLLNETVKYSNSSIELIDFETADKITKKSIDTLSSDIMKQAFLDAIKERFKASGIDNVTQNEQGKKTYNKEEYRIEILDNKNNKYTVDGKKIK